MLDDITLGVLVVHALLAPVYIVLSVIRHESAHGLAALLSGLDVVKIEILPTRRDGRWQWGWTEVTGGVPSGHFYLAPHYVNGPVLFFGLWMTTRLAELGCSLHLAVGVFVMLVISPVADTLYAVGKGLVTGTGDLAEVWGREG